VQTAQERHTRFSDAVRSLRRPDDWQRHRDRVITWARAALADPHLLVIDVQTTGLHAPYALQIAATDRHGRQVLDHTLNPQSATRQPLSRPDELPPPADTTQDDRQQHSGLTTAWRQRGRRSCHCKFSVCEYSA
jgi:hypothetical protein